MTPAMRDILAARHRIRGQVEVTPLRHSEWLSASAGAPVALKLECVQRTGSFKIRGAFNALARLEPCAHVVTASAGNHGRAVAVAAAALGMQATVFAPRDAPKAKLAAIAHHHATLHLESSYDASEAAARTFARLHGLPYVSPYNDADVIAGAGTIALEVFDVDAWPDTIVVPVGGGGLISGVAIAAKSIAPRIRVIGVEAAASCAMRTSLDAARIVTIEPQPTLADGLAGNLEPGAITFDIVQRYVDDIVTVTEVELARAVARLASEEQVVVEGAGAAAVAAMLAGKLSGTGATVALVSGANIDVERLISILREHPGE